MVELKISRGIVILVAVIAVAVVAVLLVGKTPNVGVPATGLVVANAVAPTPTTVAQVLKEKKLDSSPKPTTPTPTATPAQTPPTPTVEPTATPVPTSTPAAKPTQIAAAAPTSTPIPTPTPEPVCTLESKQISLNYYTPEGALYQNLLLTEGNMGMQANEPNSSSITTNVYGITGSCSSSCTPEEGSHADVEFMLNGTVQARQANFMAGDSITFTDGSRVAVEAIAIDCELR